MSSKRAPGNGNLSSILDTSKFFFPNICFFCSAIFNFQLHCIIITTALTSLDEEYYIELGSIRHFSPHRDNYQFGLVVNASRREVRAPGSSPSHSTSFFQHYISTATSSRQLVQVKSASAVQVQCSSEVIKCVFVEGSRRDRWPANNCSLPKPKYCKDLSV